MFAEYFKDLVSEWNPCYDHNGNARFKWDEDIGAHDVEVDVGEAGAGSAARVSDVNPRQPERTNLRAVLDKAFKAYDDGAPLDLTPLRQLVAALVQTSCRHNLHKMEKADARRACLCSWHSRVSNLSVRLSVGLGGTRGQPAYALG